MEGDQEGVLKCTSHGDKPTNETLHMAFVPQFLTSGCENCGFFGMEGDRERVSDCTTPNFQSLLTVMDPSTSWTAKWQHLGDSKP